MLSICYYSNLLLQHWSCWNWKHLWLSKNARRDWNLDMTRLAKTILSFLNKETSKPSQKSRCPYHAKKINQPSIHKSYSSISSHLKALNQEFLANYSDLKKKEALSLGKQKAVLLAKEDQLILLVNGIRKVVDYVPPLYHELKALSHIACGLYTLDTLAQSAIIHQEKQEIERKYQSYQDLIKKLLLQLQQEKTSHRLKKYVSLVKKYQDIVESRKVSSHVLSQLRSDLAQTTEEAAILRLHALHQRMKEIRISLSQWQWDHLIVTVLGPQTPRVGELAMQYFAYIGGHSLEKPAGKKCPYLDQLEKQIKPTTHQRLYYAESINKEEDALNFITVHLADDALGKKILGDGSLIRRDVLSKPTSYYLAQVGSHWKKELNK